MEQELEPVAIVGETQPPTQCPECGVQLAVHMANQAAHYNVDIAECDETTYQLATSDGTLYGDELTAFAIVDDAGVTCRNCATSLI